ncbi:hypothetical protein KS4_02120 [Poriferisphaera corsica]|uniref:DUF6677 domain-containing protein n=1 Tax=Poriferisphaera corsica TaxID=2528020 RepID=A0A517YPN2_9BACT|nr:DUF6677 family protein [Poriferisphaera corsica]QDU32183.1 hypothetical protein KS4_02120 [Poriferisphaera corsica]
MENHAAEEREFPQWHIVPAIAGWLLPGLGHLLIGEKKRGLILLVAISGLWFGGLLIGGVGTFDRSAHPAWFMGQSLNGGSIVAWQVQEYLKNSGPGATDPGPQNRYQPPYGHVESQAILYTALAGLLNLLAMIDVVYRDPKHHRQENMGDETDEGAEKPNEDEVA